MNPLALSQNKVDTILQFVPKPSARRLINYLAQNPDTPTARVRGQTCIFDIAQQAVQCNQILLKYGLFISYKMVDDDTYNSALWGIYKIPDHKQNQLTSENLEGFTSAVDGYLTPIPQATITTTQAFHYEKRV